jgi:hypothetical protein
LGLRCRRSGLDRSGLNGDNLDRSSRGRWPRWLCGSRLYWGRLCRLGLRRLRRRSYGEARQGCRLYGRALLRVQEATGDKHYCE